MRSATIDSRLETIAGPPFMDGAASKITRSAPLRGLTLIASISAAQTGGYTIYTSAAGDTLSTEGGIALRNGGTMNSIQAMIYTANGSSNAASNIATASGGLAYPTVAWIRLNDGSTSANAGVLNLSPITISLTAGGGVAKVGITVSSSNVSRSLLWDRALSDREVQLVSRWLHRRHNGGGGRLLSLLLLSILSASGCWRREGLSAGVPARTGTGRHDSTVVNHHKLRVCDHTPAHDLYGRAESGDRLRIRDRQVRDHAHAISSGYSKIRWHASIYLAWSIGFDDSESWGFAGVDNMRLVGAGPGWWAAYWWNPGRGYLRRGTRSGVGCSRVPAECSQTGVPRVAHSPAAALYHEPTRIRKYVDSPTVGVWSL